MTAFMDEEPPSQAMLGLEHSFTRAGTPAQQRAVQRDAWSRLETYGTPSGLPGSRISNEVLGSRDWRVQLTPHAGLMLGHRVWLDALVSGCSLVGIAGLFGTTVNPSEQHSAVWALGLDPDAIGLFFHLHYFSFHMVFDNRLSCIIHANDGDFVAYAGPEKWLRAALPPQAIGRAATIDVVEGVEEEHGPGCMDGILEHYAPFMLDDD